MKKQWLLASAAFVATLAVSLAVVRWLAPGLLGVPIDLQLVRVAKEVPPFFDNIFRQEDQETSGYIILDPHLKRAQPLYPDQGAGGGPHDLLGFRNASIPNRPEIIAIGDSQTYGNNVPLARNWPSQLRSAVDEGGSSVYNMAVGGWGAVEYLEIFSKALYFRPRIIIVAFYTGNDPLESYRLAYGHHRFADLRPDPSLSPGDMPSAAFPPPEAEWWPVTFPDGLTTVFTPELRLASNLDHPAVEAGYAIMAEVSRRIAALAGEAGVRTLFTVIPTKELAYARKVKEAGLEPPAAYTSLVEKERENIRGLVAAIEEASAGRYIEVVEPLQAAASLATPLYPTNLNGHPIATGYRLIGQVIARGLAAAQRDADRQADLFQEAWGHQSAGRSQKAISLYEELLEINPQHDQGAFNLAYALIRKGSPDDLARAIALLEPLIGRRPDYTEVLYRLGEAHWLRGEREQARGWYQRFIDAGGHPDLIAQARQRL